MRKRPCLLFACIFLTGIVFQRYDWKVLWFVPIIFLGLEIYYGIGYYVRNNVKSQKLENEKTTLVYRSLKRIAGRSLVLLSAFFLGVSNIKVQEDFRNIYLSKMEDNMETVVYGEILRTEETEYGSRLILTDCYVSLNETILPCNKVMVYVSSDQYHIGQIYQIKGKIHLFEQARNEGNFDALLFYQSQKIDFSIYASECVLLSCKENVLQEAILTLKDQLANVYRSSLKEDVAGFYMGMMLGDKSLLSEQTKELFAVGGISHILAISGLHISIIGRGFYTLLRKRRVGFGTAGVLAGVVLLAYCYMVGSGMSAVRALGMMLLFFASQILGRSYDMLNSLGAMVIYLLCDNPFLIEYSGFQFSITALIGVGFVGQTLSEIEEKHDEKSPCMLSKIKKHVTSSLWMSMGITLTTLPIVAACYFEIPLYSPLVNTLVLPMLTPVFALAVFGGLIGCLFPVIGKIVLIPCGWLYEFYEFICEFVAGLPLGSVITGQPRMEVVVLYYAVLACGCVIMRKWMNFRKEEAKLCNSTPFVMTQCRLILTLICFFIIAHPKPLQSEIIFLDVGQGDGIYIASEDGTTCFIDGGSSDINEVGKYRILPFLKAHGVKNIDYWFVSHADADHTSGLFEVMEAGYAIGSLVISDKMTVDENREKLLDLAKQQEISIIQMKAGECIQSVGNQKNTLFSETGIRIISLYPWSEGTDKNEQSLVLLVEVLDEREESTYKALFSGDISTKAETELIHKGILEEIDLYKAAHHGSKYSNSKAFLDVIQPKVCVVSCGAGNSYGHPHTEAVENMEMVGAEVVYTMERGQVTFLIPSNRR